MRVDPATLKPGDRIRTQTGDRASEATVLAVDGGDIFARNNFGFAFVTDGRFWVLVPPPPLIDPERVWCLGPLSETIFPENSVYTGWPRFRITQTEVVE
jgi:hypothetical protein